MDGTAAIRKVSIRSEQGDAAFYQEREGPVTVVCRLHVVKMEK
jgi:hypothetical protein